MDVFVFIEERNPVSFKPPPYEIAASILSADFARLGEQVRHVLSAGAHRVHFDVMDNHYVPNLSVGAIACDALRKANITAPIDVHLMASPVETLIPAFAQSGATSITVHPDATRHLDRTLQLIHDVGCEAGIAFNPGSPMTCLPHVIHHLSSVLIMSVNPGFGGQPFLNSALKKLQAAQAFCQEHKPDCTVAVDGGINVHTAAKAHAAGARLLVVGSGLFGYQADKTYAQDQARYRDAMTALHTALTATPAA